MMYATGGSLNNKFQSKQVLQMQTTLNAATILKGFLDFFFHKFSERKVYRYCNDHFFSMDLFFKQINVKTNDDTLFVVI